MTTTALDQIAELLGEMSAPGGFSARRTAAAEDLHIEVKGFGPLRFPISQAQAKRLCSLARPARYGRGEQTLLDRQVRDTWSIPKSRVKIDQRQWNRTLRPVLEGLRADLGLPDGCRLKVELHGMLVYGPGQFFQPHQDSEKADEMIGTLVVTLPSAFEGGAIVVEHQGDQITYRASKRPLSFIAFLCRLPPRGSSGQSGLPYRPHLQLAGRERWSSIDGTHHRRTFGGSPSALLLDAASAADLGK